MSVTPGWHDRMQMNDLGNKPAPTIGLRDAFDFRDRLSRRRPRARGPGAGPREHPDTPQHRVTAGGVAIAFLASQNPGSGDGFVAAAAAFGLIAAVTVVGYWPI